MLADRRNFLLLLLVPTVPVMLVLLTFALRKYPGPLPLLGWNAERPVWSMAWGLIFAICIGLSSYWALDIGLRDPEPHPMLVIQGVLNVWLMLVLHSAIVMQPRP